MRHVERKKKQVEVVVVVFLCVCVCNIPIVYMWKRHFKWHLNASKTSCQAGNINKWKHTLSLSSVVQKQSSAAQRQK